MRQLALDAVSALRLRRAAVGCVLAPLVFVIVGCGGGSGSITHQQNNPPTVSLTASASSINAGDSVTLTWSSSNANSCSWMAGLSGTLATSGTATDSPSATTTYTMQCTGDGGSATKSVTVTVNAPASTITAVSVSASASTVAVNRTVSFTATVSGTGSFSTAVDWTTTGGTLSATTGSSVTLTAPASAGSVKVTATSHQDSTKSGSASVTVTAAQSETLTVTDPVIYWVDDGKAQLGIGFSQTGMPNNVILFADPYESATYSTAPAGTFSFGMNLSGLYTTPNADGTSQTTSSGAYDFHFDKSNHQYVPVMTTGNSWVGYNSTDEFVKDLVHFTTCGINLATGVPEKTCIPRAGWLEAVDGDLEANVEAPVIGVEIDRISTGANLGGNGETGDRISGLAIKNSMVGYTATDASSTPKVSFFDATLANLNITDYKLSSGSAYALAMGKGCSGTPANGATATVLDPTASAPRLIGLDAVAPSTQGGSIAVSVRNIIALPPMQAPSSNVFQGGTEVHTLVMWDSNCQVGVLAPFQNPNTGGYSLQFVLSDLGKGTVLGEVGLNGLQTTATAIRMAPVPGGNAVVIAGVDQANGKSTYTEVSWTLDGSGTPAFTVKELTNADAATPVGMYAAGLGVLPSGQISAGQRGTRVLLPLN